MTRPRRPRRPPFGYPVRGDLLMRARLLRALTRAEVAAEIGVAAGAVRRAEDGGPIRLNTIRLLATFYGLDPSDIIVLEEGAA